MIKIYVITFACILLIFSCKNVSDNSGTNEADSTETIESLTQQLRANPDNPALLQKRAGLYMKHNEGEKALIDLEYALSLDSLNPQLYIDASELSIRIAKSEKAKKWLEKAEKLLPRNTDILIKLAELHLFVRQYTQSMEYLVKIQEIDPTIAKIYLVKGIIYKETGDTARATENLLIATQYKADYYDAFVMLGLLKAAQKDTIANQFYQTAINIQPDNPEAYYNMGYFLQEEGEYDRAINKYTQIVEKMNPKHQNAWFNLGYIYMAYKKDYKKAIEYYTQAIESKTNYFEAYNNRGYCYELLNDLQNAASDYSAALQILPNYKLSLDGLNRIEKNK